MASPVGHTLCGITCLVAVEIAQSPRFRALDWKNAVLFAFLANLPDIDFFLGYLFSSDPHRFHSGPTHSLVFAFTAGLVFGCLFFRSLGPVWSWLIPTGVILSHSLIDLFTGPALGLHTSYGVSLFWPFEEGRIRVPLSLFLGVHHDNWERLLSLHNLWVMGIELVSFVLPILALAVYSAKKGRRAATRKNRWL
jgi:inner membrane protein